MDDDLAARLQALEDRAAINELVIRYAEAVDNRDNDALAACFTDDAEASFAGVAVPGRGGGAIVAFLSWLAPVPRQSSTPMPSSHMFMNVVIILDGDEADARSLASVYTVRGVPEQVRIRGIRYHDRMRRTAQGWRIAKRVHSPLWEGAAQSAPLTPITPITPAASS